MTAKHDKTGMSMSDYTDDARNVLPNGLTLLQVNPDCAARLDPKARDHGWLYIKGADGQWVTHRTLTPEAWKRLCNADIWPVTPKSFQRMLDVLMEVAISNSPEFDGIKMVESHLIKAPDCRTCANRGRVDGLSQETHCEHCCHQPSIGLTSHYAPISESVLALNEADSSESAPEGMILMPMKADEHLVAEVRRLREENERLRIEYIALRADAERIDWLADVNNTVGNVILPREIVESNIGSLRQAIDAARGAKPEPTP